MPGPTGHGYVRGCLKSLTIGLKWLAQKGDGVGFRAHVRSDALLVAFNGLDPERRQSARAPRATPCGKIATA
jgi:hypothetical protein